MKQLRPYQQELIDEIYNSFRDEHDRVIGWLATGGGKSIIFANIVQDFFDSGWNIVITVKRRKLITQAEGHLRELGLDYGVYMAGHHRFFPKKKIQICSINTLSARRAYPHCDKENTLVIVDECHDCNPKGKEYRDFFNAYVGKKIIGLTATPFADNSLFQKIIKTIDNFELRDQGFLVPDKTYVPNVINVEGIKTVSGDYNKSELAEAASTNEVIGDIISDWKKYSENRRTILFAVNIEHSKLLCKKFNEAGIKAIHCDGTDNDNTRNAAIKKMVEEDASILCNVNIFSTGVDIPEIECIQFARPTKSTIFFLQAVGRGLRPAPWINKTNCIIIDNAGNTLRHGTAYMVRDATVAPKKGKAKAEDIPVRNCSKCYLIYESKLGHCPECGYIEPKQERSLKEKEGELVEYTPLSKEEQRSIKMIQFQSHRNKLRFMARSKNLGQHWVHTCLVKKFGVDFVSSFDDNLGIPEYIINKAKE